MNLTADAVRKTYAGLRRAKVAAYNTAEEERYCRTMLEAQRADAILNNRITGKNEGERDACARQVLAEHFANLSDATEAAFEAKHHVELAALAVEELRVLLRLEELAAYTQAGASARHDVTVLTANPPSHNGG